MPLIKVSLDMLREVKRLAAERVKQCDIAVRLDISQGTVSRILNEYITEESIGRRDHAVSQSRAENRRAAGAASAVHALRRTGSVPSHVDDLSRAEDALDRLTKRYFSGPSNEAQQQKGTKQEAERDENGLTADDRFRLVQAAAFRRDALGEK